MQSRVSNTGGDWQTEHHVHMSVCAAVLNFTQVSEVLVDLQRKLPEVATELLLSKARDRFKRLVNAGIAAAWITEGSNSRDLTAQEAIQALDDAFYWHPCGGYLATSKVLGTTYFETIYQNLLQYARYGIADA